MEGKRIIFELLKKSFMKIKLFNKITIFVIAIGLIFPILFISFYKSPSFNYNAKMAYQYNFDNSDAKNYDLKLINNKIKLPTINDKNTSAFLKIETHSSFYGRFFQPSITLISNDKRINYYFEKGARQTRYLNISEFINSNITTIEIEGDRININARRIKLYVFSNIDIEDKKTLIIAPHPDDAEIAAYGLYAKNKNTFIATITAGDAGPFTYDEIYKDSLNHYLKKGKLRTWNSLTVPLLGGITYQNIVNLGFFDTTLEEMYEKNTLNVKSVFCNTSDINTFREQNISSIKYGFKGTSNWRSLVNNLSYLLDTIKPEIIVCPYPIIDSHLDHKYSTVALIEALKNSKIKSGYLLLYTNHHPLSESYPYGKLGDPISLPPNFNYELYFTSIYSNPLSKSLQQDKLFALEAMNDLRLDTEWLSIKGSIKIALKNIKRKFLGPQIDYYRRSVRANELFFVIPVSDIYNIEKYEMISQLYFP